MPITAAEWTEGTLDPVAPAPAVEPIENDADSREVVIRFVEKNDEVGFTRAEIVRGVHCQANMAPEQVGSVLSSVPNQLADIKESLASSGIDVDRLSRVIDDCSDSGAVTCSLIERRDGEPVVYYRAGPDGETAGSCE